MCAANTSTPVRYRTGNADIQVSNKVDRQGKRKRNAMAHPGAASVKAVKSAVTTEQNREGAQQLLQNQRLQQTQGPKPSPTKTSKHKKPAQNHGASGSGLKTSTIAAPVPAASRKYNKRLPVDLVRSSAWQSQSMCIPRPAGRQPEQPVSAQVCLHVWRHAPALRSRSWGQRGYDSTCMGSFLGADRMPLSWDFPDIVTLFVVHLPQYAS